MAYARHQGLMPAPPAPDPAPVTSRTSNAGLDASVGLIILFCVLWSSAFAAAKLALADCPPFLLLAFRFLLAGGLLMGWCAATGRLRPLGRRDWTALIAAGLLNNALYLGLSYAGLTTVSSAFTAVIISANPLLTALVAGPVLGERLTRKKMLGLLLGFAGVVIVLRSRLSDGHEGVVGTLFVLAGLVALTAGTLTYKRFGTKVDLFQANGIQCLAGGIGLLPVALATESLAGVNLTPTFIGSFLYLAIAVSIGGYSLWYFILKRSSATEATALHFLMPPLGLLFGWLILGEAVPPLDFVGILPIAAGIWLVTR